VLSCHPKRAEQYGKRHKKEPQQRDCRAYVDKDINRVGYEEHSQRMRRSVALSNIVP